MQMQAVAAAMALFMAGFAGAQQPVEYRGTIGQQKIHMTLTVEKEDVTSGHYGYDSQKAEIPVVQGRYLGVTLVLVDEDGNLFHLHLKGGSPDGSFTRGKSLEGSMERGEMQLPVVLERVEK